MTISNDNKPTKVKLRVAEAQRRDVGRFIVRVNQEDMNKLSIRVGDIVELTGNKSTGAIAWPAYTNDQGKKIIRMDGSIRRNARVTLGDSITVSKAKEKQAKEITLAPSSPKVPSNQGLENIIKHRIISYPLSKGDLIRVPLGISGSIPFKVVSTNPVGIVIVSNKTNIVLSTKQTPEVAGIPHITYEDIGGLQEEIQRIREMVELPLRHPELFEKLGIDPPKGVLLYGPPGCGKTLLAKAVANEGDANFISINGPEIMSKFYGESEKRLRQVFSEAEKRAPSIIFIDELDAIAPKRGEVTGEVERRVVAQLLALMDGLHTRGQVIVVGATNRENAIDPALRRPGRFDREIEIGVPDKNGRLDILLIHTRGMPLNLSKKAENVDLKKIAGVTYGFVGADLEALCREAAMKTLRRYLPSIDLDEEQIPPELLEKLEVNMTDFSQALREVQPSAMREVLVEVPNTQWAEIGGLEDVKQQLIEAVEWPLKDPKRFKRLGIKPPRGILLYGPPGCGKTLLARAVATESEANFISIKGPEVLSKWVGESEKAIREVFRKARQSAPSIIFFDEIDAIAPKRGGGFDSGVTERVISQLLTELDGLADFGDIFVLGATNRPDIIDQALLRSGRFDRLILVDSPDLDERLTILQLYTKGMPLDSKVDLGELAEKAEGFAGSDLKALTQEAGIIALREDENAKIVKPKHFRSAFDSVHPTISEEMREWYDKITETLHRRPKLESSLNTNIM
ncbi:MAG: CDC48 family AAA ATPase [Candidatus Ranarchaeia archaeon]|jgi:transitional endoplasmic reticulum ATPase